MNDPSKLTATCINPKILNNVRACSNVNVWISINNIIICVFELMRRTVEQRLYEHRKLGQLVGFAFANLEQDLKGVISFLWIAAPNVRNQGRDHVLKVNNR
jgi:hypothetical protein